MDWYVVGQQQAYQTVGLEKDAALRDIFQIAKSGLTSLLPERLLPAATRTRNAAARALAEAPLPAAEQARFNAINEWINTQRVPQGWRVTHEGLGLEPWATEATAAAQAAPTAARPVLKAAALKLSGSPFPKLQTDPFREIHRRLGQAFEIEMPKNDIGEELGRMFKDPLSGLHMGRH